MLSERWQLDVQRHGEVTPDGADYLETRLQSALRGAPGPVGHVRGRLSRHEHEKPAVIVAQVRLDVAGRPVRVQTRGTTVAEAVDRLADRLRSRLENLDRRPRDRAAHPAPLPGAEPRVSRRKSALLSTCTIDVAVDELEFMDYDFHLFVEDSSGTDSVVVRDADAGYALLQTVPEPWNLVPFETAVHLDTEPPPVLTEEEAVTRLVILDEPYLFFTDRATGRGCVLYRRLDGDLGLLSPAPAGRSDG
ncbi:sigma 54 modulation/S30EA ribosomal C-terminal domain-containing protein [Spongisporangium articulatum]|uniref:Sigma 54 modulation/S30EA ribosomal C-terminal domain-containing protein n=1 Tax=Spongisporangium articulatum TaxID=3362603 RepID=A0ABW8AMX9_9ACTN